MKALLPLHDQRGCLGVQNHPYSSSLTSIIILASLDLENYPSLDLNNLKTEMLLVLPSLETRQTLISLVLRLTQYKFYNHTQYIMYIGSWQKRICIESMLLSLINLILNLKWYDACRGQRCRREFALKAFLPVQNHRYSTTLNLKFWHEMRWLFLVLKFPFQAPWTWNCDTTCDMRFLLVLKFLISYDQNGPDKLLSELSKVFLVLFLCTTFLRCIPKHYQGCIFNFVLCSNFKFAGTNLFFHVSAFTP